MVSGHLIVKLYLWLLLALTLSVLGAGGVIALLNQHELEQRAREWVLSEVRPARDVVQNLMQAGLMLPELRQVLAPLRRTARVTLQVLDERGQPVLASPRFLGPPLDGPPAGEAPPPGTPPDARPGRAPQPPGPRAPEPPPLSPETVRRVLGGEEVLQWYAHDHVLAALPIILPDGRAGVFYLTARRFRWGHDGIPWRLLAGLAATLVVLWLLSWPLAAHLARPLQRMAAAADAFGLGDLSMRIAPRDVQRHGRRRWRHDEIGRLAESFNRMAENLQRLVLGHKQLLADVSHELRSPLARLRLALELARGAQGAEQARYLGALERQADAMEELIGELLLHSRLSEAPSAVRPEPVALETLVHACVAAQQPEAEAKRVILRADVPGDLPTVLAERALLARAIANGLRNAVVYSPPGGTVELSVRREGERVRIVVRDEGPGVAPDQLERIFEPFVRTDAARGRETGGVGLGLAIVRRCMEAHGGGASAALGPHGRGLVLELWLPLPAAGGS